MRARPRHGLLLAFALLTAAFAQWGPSDPFPHRRHAKVFPTCAGCHEGVITEEATNRFPSPDACTKCHDGSQLARVSWTGPHPRGKNLKFSHVEHVRETEREGTNVDCQSCHREAAGDSSRMAVGAALPTNCISCHAHRAPEHLADAASCSTCHVPLAMARAVSDSAVAAFPRPASHARSDFVSAHAPTTSGDAARCATCHTAESCARCHPNGRRVSAIAALGSDPRIGRLVASKAAVYPTPADHRDPLWDLEHAGAAKRDVRSCANCHAQPSCRSCHTGQLGASAIAELPDGGEGGGAGVQLRRLAANVAPRSHRQGTWKVDHGADAKRGAEQCAMCHAQQSCRSCHTGAAATSVVAQLPDIRQEGRASLLLQSVAAADSARVVRVHPANFVASHGTTAGSGRLSCQGCHEQRFCSDCHDGSGRYRFHEVNYVSRHAADAYSRDRSCSSCHNTETFCRTCHLDNGIASRGGVRGTAHNGQPMWLLQHGQAARQGLEGCTSCHQQRDCLRCHSATGLHMNPHGPGFRASQMQSRNRQVCLVCHASDPLAK